MFEKLFSPIKIRGMELANRVIFPAMGTKFSGKTSYVTDQLINYHVARVKGGSALNIVEVTSVHTPSAPRGFLSLSEDEYIPGMKRLTDAIHAAGGKASLQLWQGSICVGMDQTAQILVASDMPVSPEITIPGITVEQIKEIVVCYANAAARAVTAGFDSIELHFAHNYLPHSFLSGGINRRTDEYGGSLENRARFPLEIIHAVRNVIPEDMPLFMRVCAHDDYLEGGLTIEEVITFCKWAGEAGVDVLDISRGNVISAGIKYEVPPIDLPRGFNIENASRIRKETGILTIGVGRINTPDQAERYLETDKVDMVVMGRSQLADPEFLSKSASGNTADIDYCIGCDQGCLDGFSDVNTPFITCLRNPALGKEVEWAIEKTDKPETVLVAGGGIAGLMAAITLCRRGHTAILCEASGELGGQFRLAGEAPRKEEMKDEVLHMAEKAKRLGADIRLNTPVTAELIKEIKPHTVINAIGAVPIMPSIPGADQAFVVDAHDILSGRKSISGDVVVIGGGMVGMEVSEYLSACGSHVTNLEMLPDFCMDMGSARKACVAESIYIAGIQSVTNVRVLEITKDSVIGELNGEKVSYPCTYAVMAVGSKSRDGSALEAACYENGIGYFAVGDAALARKAIDATKEAYEAALTFDKPEVFAYSSKPKKVVVLTGGSGIMGQETLKQLLDRSLRFKIRAIIRPSAKNKELMKKYLSPSLEIIWGDMTDYDTVKRSVDGADYVLHVGAMVSPMSDKYPKETLETNIGSTLNFIKAIKEQPDPDKVHLVYVGTVAMTGGRTAPIHWGRVGDPINPSIFDYYGMSKVFAEMALFESGLKHWVSIRQTGQHPSNEAASEEPITFHQPINNVLEWSTSIESGICMANICEDFVPETFWRKAYNLSSGKGFRLATWELMDMNLGAFGYKFSDLFDSKMLATYNFHGQYYTDADKLNDILHFRVIPADVYWGGVREEMRRMAANPMIKASFPTKEQMRENFIRIGKKTMGTYWMFENNEEDWIKAFYGSREKHAEIKSFDEGFELFHPSEEPTYLDHGYDENKGLENLTLTDLQKAAAFRGGKCLADSVADIDTPITWECCEGHTFDMSVNAALHGGHWCPKCISKEWRYGLIARKNPYYAQVWLPIHGDTDDYVIPMEHSAFDTAIRLKKELGL